MRHYDHHALVIGAGSYSTDTHATYDSYNPVTTDNSNQGNPVDNSNQGNPVENRN